MGDQAMSDARIEPARVGAQPRGGEKDSLLNAAHPLLMLACQLRLDPLDEELETLRERLCTMVDAFDASMTRAGIDAKTCIAVRYCMCTFIDEIIAATPPGGGGAWASRSLLILFHGQASGGERFFSILRELTLDASANLEALELLYVMLALGMEGRYRLLEGGRGQLDAVRDALRRQVAAERGPAPAWPGVIEGRTDGARGGFRRHMPAMLALGSVALFALLAAALPIRLQARAQPIVDTLAQVRVALARAHEPTESPEHSLAAILAERLGADLAAQRLTLAATRQKVVITLGSDALFASGSATVLPQRVALLRRIGVALRDLDARIVVQGHTDDQPPSPGRPSNWQLSLARATQVVDLLREEAGGAQRFLAQGRGASEPVASNELPMGRARNRRVAIAVVAGVAPL